MNLSLRKSWLPTRWILPANN